MNFADAQAYLYSLGNEVSAMKLGLENIRKLLDALGDPQNNYLKVQVAGTNGKGSVCAFLDSICSEAGVKRGVFTSPHLVSIRERIRINGTDITEDDFARHATSVRSVAEDLLVKGVLEYLPTFFEQVTAIALVAFADAKVELAILESGLGGRLDATTAANAEVVAITRIDLDHQEYLGETIEEIAAEKAAVIQDPSQSVVIGAQPEAASAVIQERCKQLIFEPNTAKDYKWKVYPNNGDVRVETYKYSFPYVILGLKGKHQLENAGVAVNVMHNLRFEGGISFDDDDIVTGLQNARHPGRLEFSGKYLFDGAHNVGGANALREYLDENVSQPITMIFGAMKGKDISQMASTLFPKAQALILTSPQNSRAMSASDIAKEVPTTNKGNLSLTETVPEAINLATALTPDNGIILITGSLYLVGEAKRILNN